jgi:hypothetical protein
VSADLLQRQLGWKRLIEAHRILAAHDDDAMGGIGDDLGLAKQMATAARVADPARVEPNAFLARPYDSASALGGVHHRPVRHGHPRAE